MILLIARFVQILLSVVSIKLSSHLLVPEQMGRFALVNSTFALFVFIFINPVGMFMNRRMHAWWRDGRWLNYNLWFAAYLFVVAVLAAASFVLAEPLYRGLQMQLGWMLVLICGSLIVTTSNQSVIAALNLLGYARPFAVATVLTPVLSLGLAWAFCEKWRADAEFWLSGLLAGQALVGVAAALVLYGHWNRQTAFAPVHPRIGRARTRRLFVYAWPISLAVVLGWAQNQGYRLVLEDQVGLKSLGIFVAAYGIALGIMSAAESLLNSVLQPRFYRRLNGVAGEPPVDAWNEYASVALPLLVLTAGTLAAVSDEAVHLFLAPAYWNTVDYLRWAAVIELTRTAANVFALAMHAEMNTRRLIAPSVIGAALSIALLVIGSSRWGLEAVGPALALAGTVYLASYHFAARNLSNVRLPTSRALLAALGAGMTFLMMLGLRQWTPTWDTVAASAARTVPAVLIYVGFAALLLRPAMTSREARSS